MNRKFTFLILAFCIMGVALFNPSPTFNAVTDQTSETQIAPISQETSSSQYLPHPLSSSYIFEENYQPQEPVPIPAIIDQISLSSFQNYLNHLSNTIGSRVYDTEGNEQAAEYIAQQFEEAGLEVSFQEFGSSATNVVGKLPGASIHNNECIVVGAHYDTFPASSKGADDNGSGVAAVLEIARVLSRYQFNYTFYFVAFDAEEIGLFGSSAFADYLHDSNIPIASVYNFDMIIWDNPSAPVDTKYEIIHNGGASEVLATHAETIGLAYNLPVSTRYAPGLTMSDHSPFWNYNDPAVWFFEYGGLGNPYIHSSADALNQPDYSFELGTQVTKNAAAALADFATIVSTIPGFPNVAFVPPTPTQFVPPTDNVPLVLEISDSHNDVNKVELSINNAPWIDITTGMNSTHSTYYWNATGVYGLTSIRARVFDSAGWMTHAHRNFRVDKGLNCAITSPSSGDQIPQGTPYTIWINTSDLDGYPIVAVQVNINNTKWRLASTHIFNKRYFYNWTVTGNGSTSIQVRAIDANGYTNTSVVYVEVVQYLPQILEVSFWPRQPFETTTIQVSARITQNPLGADIYNVQVIFSIDNSYWKHRRLFLIESDIFSADIGPFPAGSQILFYIEVQDYNDNIVQDTRNGEYYTFMIGIDPTNGIVAGSIAIITIISSVVVASVCIIRKRRKITE